MEVLWETEFKHQLKHLLNSHGIEISDITILEKVLPEINYRESPRCALMIEVDDNWQNKVIESQINK